MKIEQNGSCLKIKGLQHQEALPSSFKKTKFSWVSYNNFSQLGPSAPFGLQLIFINSVSVYINTMKMTFFRVFVKQLGRNQKSKSKIVFIVLIYTTTTVYVRE